MEDTLDAVARASTVFSTSLHGVIVADAFGRPALPVLLGPSRKHYRFDDYHSGLDVPGAPLHSIDDLSAERARSLAAARADLLGDRPAAVGARVGAALSAAVAGIRSSS